MRSATRASLRLRRSVNKRSTAAPLRSSVVSVPGKTTRSPTGSTAIVCSLMVASFRVRPCRRSERHRTQPKTRFCDPQWLPRVESAASSRGVEGLVAALPIARGQFARLQRVERTQHFVDVAADRQIVNAGEADDAFGIDDEGRAQGDAV